MTSGTSSALSVSLLESSDLTVHKPHTHNNNNYINLVHVRSR